GWRHLMTHYRDQILACDFFTVETLFLQTLYVFFFIELGSRRVHFAGCTSLPIPTGSTNKPVKSHEILKNARHLITSCFTTTIESSQRPSTPSLPLEKFMSSIPQCVLPMPTHMTLHVLGGQSVKAETVVRIVLG